MLCYVVVRCLQHVSLNDATQKNLSLSANINIRRIAWFSCFKQYLFETLIFNSNAVIKVTENIKDAMLPFYLVNK